jgi:putative ABC transport system permease protein
MRPGDLFATMRFALAHRARAALTLLGIVIGTSSIVLLAGLLRGGEEALTAANQEASDADLIEVHRDDVSSADLKKTRRELSRADSEALGAAAVLDGAATIAEASHPTRALLGAKKKRITLVGARPESKALYRIDIDKGRFLDADDEAERRRVCVVGREVYTELLEGRPELDGVALSIDGRLFSVVGALKAKPMLGATDGTNIWNRKVLIPETTYDAIFAPSHDVDRVFVRRRNAGPLSLATPMTTLRSLVDRAVLRRHLGVHNFKLDDEKDKGTAKLILTIIKMLLFTSGLLALLVGGINIMNVMLVTVTERTREIGIRRAVGATPGLILAQFLLEAGFISLLGGMIGVAAGVAVSWAGAVALRALVGAWPLYVEPWSIALGLALSLATGIAFGLYPAWRAARLDPIEALRFE